MSIESEITRINNNIAATYTALSAKGATMPETENSANLASTVETVPSGGDPVNKSFDVTNGVLSMPKNITFSDNTFADVTSISYYALYYKYYCKEANASNPSGVVKFDNVTSIGSYGLSNTFNECNIESVSFNSLVQLNGDYSLASSFKDNKNLTSISFPSLNSIKGKYALTYCFNGCDSLTSVSFPELETATGYSCFDSFLSECTVLTTVSFPKLKTLGGNSCYNTFYRDTSLTSVDFPVLTSIESSGLYYAFNGCKALTSISFPALTTVGSSSFSYCFQNCTGLTTISFPALTTIQSNSFTNCFKNCTNLTSIRFPAAIQTDIEATTGYDTKWGASNATIYFDL